MNLRLAQLHIERSGQGKVGDLVMMPVLQEVRARYIMSTEKELASSAGALSR